MNRFALFVIAVLLGSSFAHAQDPASVAAKSFKVRLNNEFVRVLEYRSKPGEKEVMHSHPAQVLYFVKGGKMKQTTADGKVKETDYKDGETIWREPITHAVQNVGKTEVHAMLFEWKHSTK